MTSSILRTVCLLALLGTGILRGQETLWQDLEQKRLEGADSLSYSGRFEQMLPWFLGKDYEEKTLDQQAEEELVIYTGGFDCVTFVENVLAACRSLGSEGLIRDDFSRFIRESRYYDGKVHGYESRIHYFSDWMRQAVLNGRGTWVATESSSSFDKKVNFMSSHPDKYPLMRDRAAIEQREQALNANLPSYFPKGQLSQYQGQLQTGDVIALTTNIKGLDVVHTGMAYREGGKVYLVHASSKYGKVRKQALKDYLNTYNYINGIIVLRPIMNE